MSIKSLLGFLWERKAESYLKKKGYRILERNFRTKFGEIDIVAKKGDEIVFVEVKGRSGNFQKPEEAVDERKMRRIKKAATIFLKKKGLWGNSVRFDVVAIDKEGIRHIEGAYYGF